MDRIYYTYYGDKIRFPNSYAKTGAPMYLCLNNKSKNINLPTKIYKLDLEHGKIYIGKTTNFNRRMKQHFSGNGAKVTKKFRPITSEVIDIIPGFLSSKIEHKYTKKYIEIYGYKNVRGGYFTNSKNFR